MGRASKDKRDIYYRKAKEEGFRARSAYKLLQIHEEYNILDKHKIRNGAVDLCAAPGSWSQVLAKHFQQVEEEERAKNRTDYIKPGIVSVDLQEMAPIEGVVLLQGDITSEATSRRVLELLQEHHRRHNPSQQNEIKADIVICDGAPDVTGMHELDEYLQHQLLLAALLITTCVLAPGGCFVTKMFRGPNTPFLIHKSEIFFEQVRVVKPRSSRNASMEAFLLCQGFRLPPGYVPRLHLRVTPEVWKDALTEEGPVAAQVALQGGAHYTPEAPYYTQREAPQGNSPTADGSDTPVDTSFGLTVVDETVSSRGKPSRWVLPFLACGDLSGFDADMCYDRDPSGSVLPPVQPPLQAPYLAPRSTSGKGETASGNDTPAKRVKQEE